MRKSQPKKPQISSSCLLEFILRFKVHATKAIFCLNLFKRHYFKRKISSFLHSKHSVNLIMRFSSTSSKIFSTSHTLRISLYPLPCLQSSRQFHAVLGIKATLKALSTRNVIKKFRIKKAFFIRLTFGSAISVLHGGVRGFRGKLLFIAR